MSRTGMNDDRLGSLLDAIDAKDTGRFLEFLTERAVFRFGSTAAVTGHDDIGTAVDGFFSGIDGSTHTLRNVFRNEGRLACEGEVTYRRLDGSEITLPFTNVFELDGDLIDQYRIYIDIGPLFAA